MNCAEGWRMGQGIRVVECTDGMKHSASCPLISLPARLVLASTSARAGLGLSSFYCTSVHLPPNYHHRPHFLRASLLRTIIALRLLALQHHPLKHLIPQATAVAKLVPTIHMHRDSATDMLMILKAAVSELFC